jgi:hypothetical protein
VLLRFSGLVPADIPIGSTLVIDQHGRVDG